MLERVPQSPHSSYLGTEHCGYFWWSGAWRRNRVVPLAFRDARQRVLCPQNKGPTGLGNRNEELPLRAMIEEAFKSIEPSPWWHVYLSSWTVLKPSVTACVGLSLGSYTGARWKCERSSAHQIRERDHRSGEIPQSFGKAATGGNPTEDPDTIFLLPTTLSHWSGRAKSLPTDPELGWRMFFDLDGSRGLKAKDSNASAVHDYGFYLATQWTMIYSRWAFLKRKKCDFASRHRKKEYKFTGFMPPSWDGSKSFFLERFLQSKETRDLPFFINCLGSVQ